MNLTTIASVALVGAVLGASLGAVTGLADVRWAGGVVGGVAGAVAWFAGVRARQRRANVTR